MNRSYEYRGYAISVSVEADFSWSPRNAHSVPIEYVSIVAIREADRSALVLPPLRLGDSGGKAFGTEAEAMMTGYAAARRIIDDLFATSLNASDAHDAQA
ncbi:hypothetical protein [Pararobbsia alpina]|uniref:hypothetical protein n=1 Tax=Pararobbsia alpina TaxID=621374 RepID=UPI0039A4A2E2